MPGADAPGKFARSNARETPGKLQLETGPFARSKALANCSNPWHFFGGKVLFKFEPLKSRESLHYAENSEKLTCQGLNPWQIVHSCGKLLTAF
uniref:Uncharacterized protein n=1 Tax=Medicago truncatula TaxID=3880 RepID=Q1S5L8_MEDTR|nr:hypothetical protein MtrDRAFT_AC147431g30v2 [Medicago truncatula]